MSANKTAVVVQRVESYQEPDTREIQELARSAGYSIAEVLTQSRTEDREYNIGEGKVHESNLISRDVGADAVIVDNELDPYQMYNYGIYVPDSVTVLDRYSLILDIFEQRADTKEAQLQVELARLRYELPRAETKTRLAQRDEKPGFMGLGEYNKSKVRSIHNRIKRIKEEISTIQKRNSQRREQQRSNGFDLVTIAGYTNAGKSTLLRRLAGDQTVDQNKNLHTDIKPTAESTEDLFTTLSTTTGDMAFDKRDVLLTDTVGFIKDLPEWLIDAFGATFDSIYMADLVLLVVDATNSSDMIRERIASSHDIISKFGSTRTVTVVNKTDLVDDLDEKLATIDTVAPNPTTVSAKSGENIDELKTRIHRTLPPLQEDTLLLPLENESMSLVSWIYDNAYVNDCTYTDSSIELRFEAREDVVAVAKSKASNIITD